MAIELNTPILVALLVGAAVIAVGLVLMNQQNALKSKTPPTTTTATKSAPEQATKPESLAPSRPKKPPATPPRPMSPTATRKIATGTGLVRTPAGRRSARLARKSMEHND